MYSDRVFIRTPDKGSGCEKGVFVGVNILTGSLLRSSVFQSDVGGLDTIQVWVLYRELDASMGDGVRSGNGVFAMRG